MPFKGGGGGFGGGRGYGRGGYGGGGYGGGYGMSYEPAEYDPTGFDPSAYGAPPPYGYGYPPPMYGAGFMPPPGFAIQGAPDGAPPAGVSTAPPEEEGGTGKLLLVGSLAVAAGAFVMHLLDKK